MAKKLKLKVFHNTVKTAQLSELDVDYSLRECILLPVVFYSINAISPYRDGDEKYTCVHANGDDFIVSEDFGTVERLIDETLH